MGREGYGEVTFLEEVDVRALQINSIIKIEYGEIVVYPDDQSKPPPGQGLNVPARLTLEKVWPQSGKRDTVSLDRKEAALKRSCQKNGMKFVQYRRDSGEWVFDVPGF